MFDFETYSTIVFFILLSIILILDRKNIEFKYGIIIRKTKKGKEMIYAIGRKHKKILKIIGSIGVFVAICMSFFSIYSIANSAYLSIRGGKEVGVKFVIPSVPSKTVCKYALCVPFWYWIVGVLTVLLSHELFHAFILRAEGIRIKSFGLLTLLILPGAFVEPDEKEMKKKNFLARIKVFSAGSFGNFLVFTVATSIVLLSIFFLNSIMEGGGISFKTIPGTPAYNANLSGIILKVNENETKTLQEFIAVMEKIKPGEEIKIKTSDGTFILKTVENPENSSKAFIGIKDVSTKFLFKGPFKIFGEPSKISLSFIEWFLNLFAWISFLNLGIGLINLLPIKPLDGGLIFEEIFNLTLKKYSIYATNILSFFLLVLLLLSIFGPVIHSITSVFLISKFLIG